MDPHDYAVTVLPNMQVFRWRLRDNDVNRFKICLTSQQFDFLNHSTMHALDYDDCDGDMFATIHRILTRMP